jgi:CRP/FNR family transcriptional regulator, cyclic AMP receptor protein
MTTAGAHVPLRLSHEVLAEIVGARRPSVSVALGRLRKRGAVVRLPDRSWLLPGPPPIELSELRDFAAA